MSYTLSIERMAELISQWSSEDIYSSLTEATKNQKPSDLQISRLSTDERIFLQTQLSLKAKAIKKLPSFLNHPQIIIPSRLSLEQCSSNDAAELKARIISEMFQNSEQGDYPSDTFVDLTGGFGVDFLTTAIKLLGEHQNIRQLIYVEQNTQYVEIFRHNLEVVSKLDQFQNYDFDKIYIINSSAENFLKNAAGTEGVGSNEKSSTSKYEGNTSDFEFGRTIFFCDPDRRSQGGKKLYKLEDCKPDLVHLLDNYPISHFIFKLSPITDTTEVFQKLPHVLSQLCIEKQSEVKELLALSENNKLFASNSLQQQIGYHNLDNGYTLSAKWEIDKEIKQVSAEPGFHLLTNDILLIPSPGITKMRLMEHQNNINLKRVAPNTNIYRLAAGNEPPEKYAQLGRLFQIKSLRKYKKSKDISGSFNIITKNFPHKVGAILQKLSISEGGSLYLLCFRNEMDKHQVAVCIKI